MSSNDSLAGRVALVTGANNGIGFETALALAARGARVLGVSRDQARGESALDAIRQRTGNAQVTLLVADLSSQEATRRLAAQAREATDRLHVLVNNAGAVIPERRLTVDGLENTFALNHLGYFLLTNLLLDLLRASAPARVINVASEAARIGRLDFDDLQYERHRYSAFRAYGRSKLANIMFTYDLAERLGGSGVTVNAVHPGAVRSGFGSEFTGSFRFLMKVGRPFMRSPEKGAETVIYLATSPEVEERTGLYWSDRKPIRSIGTAHDASARRRLWEVSEQLTGLASAAPAASHHTKRGESDARAEQ